MSASKLMMRAIRVSEFGGPAVLKLCSDVAVPEPGPRQVRPGCRSYWAPLAGQRRAAALIFGAFVKFLLPLLYRKSALYRSPRT